MNTFQPRPLDRREEFYIAISTTDLSAQLDYTSSLKKENKHGLW